MVDKVYYSSVDSGTTATEITFFNQNEADDGKTVSNLPANRTLRRSFNVRKMKLIPAPDITDADVLSLLEDSVIEVEVGNNEVISMPVMSAIGSTHEVFGSNGGLTTGQTDVAAVANPADGYNFREALTIPANTTFQITLTLSATFAANTSLTFILEGDEAA